MIYEMRTYQVKPGKVSEVEVLVRDALPYREKYSKLGAFWHTEIGPLNEVVHLWPYEDVGERARIREMANQDPHWPPKVSPLLVGMRSDILVPAPFMRPLAPQMTGNIYEMRIYVYNAGTMAKVLAEWEKSVPHREKYSQLLGCWHSELGDLNKLVHLWPYKDLSERHRVREEAAKDPHWPPDTLELLVSMESKILVPAEFSPLR